MRLLAAAISPGYFGFTDWAYAVPHGQAPPPRSPASNDLVTGPVVPVAIHQASAGHERSAISLARISARIWPLRRFECRHDDLAASFRRAIQRLGAITPQSVLGGLHHQYCTI